MSRIPTPAIVSILIGVVAFVAAAVLVPATASAGPLGFDHIVVVMFENKGYDNIIGSRDAPTFNRLADGGALFTDAHGIAHPSQPNYIALFSGDTHGVTDDSCPHTFPGADNLGHQLATTARSFTGYSEDMPSAGYTGCSTGRYARKHNGWVDFDTVGPAADQPYSAFPADFARLPTVAFVTPNMCDDMHDCSVSTGDAWLGAHLGAYADWAKANNSLLVVTFDEDEGTGANHIPTMFYGAHVKPGRYNERIDHYSVLRTVETANGLPPLGHAADAPLITDVWG